MANRYWVGGTAAWDGTAGSKWALTSGGAGGQAVPTSADDVFFSSLSTGTCTISAGNTGAKSITCTGFTGTLAGSAAISVSGSVLLVAGMTYTYTGTMSILATGTITSAGKSFGSVTVNGSGITVTLGSALSLGANTFTLTQGTVDLNAFTLTTGIFSSTNTNTRAITFGSTNIVLTGSGVTRLSMADATNFTYTGTGSFSVNVNSNITLTFGTTGGSSTNAPNLIVPSDTAGANTLTFTATSHFKTIDFTGANDHTTLGAVIVYGDVTFDPAGTYTGLTVTFSGTGDFDPNGRAVSALNINGSGIVVTCRSTTTVNGALTFTDGTLRLRRSATTTVSSFVTSGTTLKYLESSTSGTQATLSDSGGTNTVTYLSIKDSAATGGASFNAISSTNVNAGNNSGWIFGGSGFFMFF
jgi:hypothetical protein